MPRHPQYLHLYALSDASDGFMWAVLVPVIINCKEEYEVEDITADWYAQQCKEYLIQLHGYSAIELSLHSL